MNNNEAKVVSLLCQAIREKRRVKFFYSNTGNKKKEWRTIEPYLIGIRKHNGKIFLTGYDLSTKGENTHDKNLGQKQFLIDRVDSESIHVLDKNFKIIRVPKERIENTPTIDVICKVSFEEE